MEKRPFLGIIGGTGIYETFETVERIEIDTPYGKPSDTITICKVGGKKVAFLPRHGERHEIPPHKVNYRANIWALKHVGVERIIAPHAVGSLKEEYIPGTLVFPDQFIDFTKKREYTFYDGRQVIHISTAEPFCPELRNILIQTAKELNINHQEKATYVCIEGPRFSTKAESHMFRQFADIIGMTIVPEAQLARELEMCYASISMVTDYDVWKEQEEVSAELVIQRMKDNLDKTKKILERAIQKIPEERNCLCKDALKGAEL